MKRYLITFDIERNKRYWHREQEVEANNAREAKRVFEELWGYRKGGIIPYPFHIKVKWLR
jgi:hypothetical protein